MYEVPFNHSVVIVEESPGIDYLFRALEFLLLIVGTISSVILLYFLASTNECHRNFKQILMVITTTCIYHGVTRLLILVFEMLGIRTQMGIIIDIKNALEFTNIIEVPAMTTAFLILVIERFVATKCVETYEKRFNSIRFVLLIWAIPSFVNRIDPPRRGWAAVMFKSYVRKLKDNIHCRLLIPSTILTVMDAAAIILGSCVCYKNKKIYKHAFISGAHELTARYQTAENIRTTRLIAPVLAIQFVSKILIASIFYFVLIFVNHNAHGYTEIFYRISAIIVAFFIAIWPWLIILRYPPYKNRMKKHKTTPECFDPCSIKNVNGMRIATNQCANEHFQQLNKFWNLDPSPTILH